MKYELMLHIGKFRYIKEVNDTSVPIKKQNSPNPKTVYVYKS